MKNRFIQIWKSGKGVPESQNDPVLEHSCTGRILNASTFIIVIVSLGLWITVFLVLKDQLFQQTFSGNLLTNLTCLIFFGGLVIALFLGAMAGNSLRRAFWKMLIRRRKQ